MNERDPDHPTYQDRLARAQERAAIHEYDGGLNRLEAEMRAASAWRVRLADVQANVPVSLADSDLATQQGFSLTHKGRKR